MTQQHRFDIVTRGYCRKDVDALVNLVETARFTQDVDRIREAQEALTSPGIRTRARGYRPVQVHQYLNEARTEFGAPQM